jgi:hypothetical protein
VGESGKLGDVKVPTKYGGQYWVMTRSTVFLLNPYYLTTMAQVDGQKKMIKEFENTIPAYGDDTVAIIPYDLRAYIKRHGFTNLSAVKRTDILDPSTQSITSKAKDMKAVLMMEESYEKSEDFKKGVYYDCLVKLSVNDLPKWKKLIIDQSKVANANIKCEKVWSYITKLDDKTSQFSVTKRIDEYLHIDELGINPNKLGDADLKDAAELRLRYMDLLMTIYTQIQGSTAEAKWKDVINKYAIGIFEKENDCNIAISAGFAARGWVDVNGNDKQVNIISGCEDFVERALCIDREYSLTNKTTADKIAAGLLKQGKGTTYYDRLLEALRLSVVKQSKSNEKVIRTYANTEGLWGSAIINRILRTKPIINGTNVSWKSGLWGADDDYIEYVYLKSKYYGTNLIPAYPLPLENPKAEGTLKVESTIAPGENPVEIKDRDVINDDPKLTIFINGKKDEKSWKFLLDSNKNFKVQVAFTRKPDTPDINVQTKKYISKAETIDKGLII